MKIDALRLGVATTIVFAVIWVICSVLIIAVPGPMTTISGHMPYAEMSGFGRHLRWGGVVFGLLLWSLLPGLLVGTIAALYNRLGKSI